MNGSNSADNVALGSKHIDVAGADATRSPPPRPSADRHASSRTDLAGLKDTGERHTHRRCRPSVGSADHLDRGARAPRIARSHRPRDRCRPLLRELHDIAEATVPSPADLVARATSGIVRLLGDDAIEHVHQRVHLRPELSPPFSNAAHASASVVSSPARPSAWLLHVERDRQAAVLGEHILDRDDGREPGVVLERLVRREDAVLMLGAEEALRPLAGDRRPRR